MKKTAAKKTLPKKATAPAVRQGVRVYVYDYDDETSFIDFPNATGWQVFQEGLLGVVQNNEIFRTFKKWDSVCWTDSK